MLGQQHPRIAHVPESAAVFAAGDEAIECAAVAGLMLDDWQKLTLRQGLAERRDGRYAALEVGVCAPRQCGKGGIIEALELAGLFVFELGLIIHSAHLFDTSKDAMRRLLELIESVPDFDRRVKRKTQSHGEEGITLKGGQRIRFRTRTKGGGRGLSGDLVIGDEAMIFPEATYGALLPTLSARPNPQAWLLGSAVDKEIHDHGLVFSRMRARAIAGEAPSLAWFEWSVDAASPELVDDRTASDPAQWAVANPALGIRITEEYVAAERQALAARSFAVERLGVGDWPSPDEADTVINLDAFDELADRHSTMVDPVVFAFDVSPDRRKAAIVAAGARPDGLRHVEVIDHRHGTGWLVERLVELVDRHSPAAVACDGLGPAASLAGELERAGVRGVVLLSTDEYAKACGGLFDMVEQRTLRHLGTSELRDAVKGAARRPLGERWAWSRKTSTVDITPLVAATVALWISATARPRRSVYERRGVLSFAATGDE